MMMVNQISERLTAVIRGIDILLEQVKRIESKDEQEKILVNKMKNALDELWSALDLVNSKFDNVSTLVIEHKIFRSSNFN